MILALLESFILDHGFVHGFVILSSRPSCHGGRYIGFVNEFTAMCQGRASPQDVDIWTPVPRWMSPHQMPVTVSE